MGWTGQILWEWVNEHTHSNDDSAINCDIYTSIVTKINSAIKKKNNREFVLYNAEIIHSADNWKTVHHKEALKIRRRSPCLNDGLQRDKRLPFGKFLINTNYLTNTN